MQIVVNAVVGLGAFALIVFFALLVIVIIGAGLFEIYDAYAVWHEERTLKRYEQDLKEGPTDASSSDPTRK